MKSSISACYCAGNELFRCARFDEAIKQYSYVLVDVAVDSIPDNCHLIVLRCLVNRGFSHFKARNYAAAVVDNSTALDWLSLWPTSALAAQDIAVILPKLFLRRSLALEYSGALGDALADLHQLQREFPMLSDTDIVRDSLLRLNRLIAMDCEVARAERKPTSMIHIAQSLRVMILSDLPRRINMVQEAEFTMISPIVSCKIGLGNEFGLFHRDSFVSASSQNIIGTLGCKAIMLLPGNKIQQCYIDPVITSEPCSEIVEQRAEWKLPQNGKVKLSS
jgi:hypothetical protein